MSSNVPWFKLALIGTFIGVSAIIGYAATSTYFKTSEAESVEPVVAEEGNIMVRELISINLNFPL